MWGIDCVLIRTVNKLKCLKRALYALWAFRLNNLAWDSFSLKKDKKKEPGRGLWYCAFRGEIPTSSQDEQRRRLSLPITSLLIRNESQGIEDD